MADAVVKPDRPRQATSFYLWVCKCGNRCSPLFDACGRCGQPWTAVQDEQGRVPVVY